jgi:hypothetical protein
MPQHEVDGALMQLVRAELIFQHGTPPDAEYTFKHALVQDATYGTLNRKHMQNHALRIWITVECRQPVLAYFGYPQAHEDDAERSVRAALTLVGGRLAAKAATALRVRVGIATGLVVVGDLTADDPAHECKVVGETPNLAARLQAVAEPDTVVIDSNTRRLLGYLFEYSAASPMYLATKPPCLTITCAQSR